jgi:hypothetical protein
VPQGVEKPWVQSSLRIGLMESFIIAMVREHYLHNYTSFKCEKCQWNQGNLLEGMNDLTYALEGLGGRNTKVSHLKIF